MKHEILREVAMPPKLFWAPMSIAVASIGIHLPLVLFIQTFTDLNPLWFVLLMVFDHFLIVLAGKKEPHLSRLFDYHRKFQNLYGPTPVLLCQKYDNDDATILFKDSFLIIFKINSGLNNDSKAKYLKEIAQKQVCVRFFYTKENTYLLVSGETKEIINDIIQVARINFSCELLTTQTRPTPSDVLKFIFNPIEDELFPAGNSLSESALLTNKRTLIKKDVMTFEQNGKKVYTSVLCLKNIENEVDFDLTNLLTSDVSVLEWIQPKYDKGKMTLLLEQQRRMARLTSPNKSAEQQFQKAQEMLDAGETFISYGLNIYVSAQSEQQLEAKKKEITEKAKQNGMTFKTACTFFPFSFYMCLPHYDLPRQFLLPVSAL